MGRIGSVLTENLAVFCSRRRSAPVGILFPIDPTRMIMIDLRRIRDDLLALALFAATIFVGLALFSYNPADPPGTAVFPVEKETTNLCGSAGAKLAHHLFTGLGYGAYFVVVCLISSDGRLFSRIGLDGLLTRTCGLVIALVAVCVGLHVLLPDFGHGPVVGTGGYVGAWGQIVLAREFATAGTLILLGSAVRGWHGAVGRCGRFGFVDRGGRLLRDFALAVFEADVFRPPSLEEAPPCPAG